MPDKIDLYRLHKSEYVARQRPALVKISRAQYLAIDGQGAPGTQTFQAAIAALYGVAFTVKMTHKFAGRQDYAVCKLEAQWWSDDDDDLAAAPRETWRWKLMIRTPAFIRPKDLGAAAATLRKRGRDNGGVERVRLESISEGTCVQMLHVGPYEKEHKTIEAMRTFARSHRMVFGGRHHEIYLSDPRRVTPSKLKTILRAPLSAPTSP